MIPKVGVIEWKQKRRRSDSKLYYQITCKPMTIKEGFDDTSPRERRNFAMSLIPRCTCFNRSSDTGAFIFIVEINESQITLGAICRDRLEEKEIKEFLRITNLLSEKIAFEEVLFSDLENLLRISDRNCHIDSCSDILEAFGLDDLTGNSFQRMTFGENLLETKKKSSFIKEAEDLLAEESFIPEIERIYAGGAEKKVPGHPVHYLVFSADRENRKHLTRLLLGALYTNGRVKSRRYGFINITPKERFSPAGLDTLYRSLVGGSLVVRFENSTNAFDGEYADAIVDITDSVCTVMKQYRNDVQTVICLPNNSENLRTLLFNGFEELAIAELHEDLVTAERARSYFMKKACKNKLRADKALLSTIEEGELYLPCELNDRFAEWFNRKLRCSVYPQYKDVLTGHKGVQKEKPQGNAYDELQSMIGLTEAKAVLQKALDYQKFNKMFKDKIGSGERPSMHMVFTGSPGTAKTTVARLFARILKDNKILSTGVMVEVGRGDLVGKYVGWTATNVKEKFRKAKGGVLFIDEAYSLVDDRSGSFGDEAINTIVQEMENHREDVVVIFAGYTDRMEEFIEKNPGLRSRISWYVPFPDYTAEELTDIAEHYAEKKGLTVSRSAEEKLLSVFKDARRQHDFGNGRYVRNLMEKAKMNLASRLVAADPETVTKRMLTTIEAEDIETPPR